MGVNVHLGALIKDQVIKLLVRVDALEKLL